jgi:hypothetical protein
VTDFDALGHAAHRHAAAAGVQGVLRSESRVAEQRRVGTGAGNGSGRGKEAGRKGGGRGRPSRHPEGGVIPTEEPALT